MERRTKEGKRCHDLEKKSYAIRKQKEKIEHEKSNAIELDIHIKNCRISDYLKEKISSGKTQILINDDGSIIQFRKKTDNGYWVNTSYYKGKIIYLHREKLKRYLKLTEEQMQDYDVHHIDFNKDNNEISNLQLLTKEDYNKLHGKSLSSEERERRRENLNKNVRPKAIEWHKSEEGRKWHKRQYEMSSGLKDYQQVKVKKICEYCGREYEVNQSNTSISRFCSNKCKSAWRRQQGIDNEERVCERCRKIFITNKYSKTKYCSIKCSKMIKR